MTVVALAATACASGTTTESVTATRSPTPTPTAITPSPTPTATSPTTSPTATSTPTATATPTVSSSPTPAAVSLVAGPTGLRAVQLGEAESEVMAEMRARFGAPDADSGWVPAGNSPFGVCPGAARGAEVRGVRWGRVRLLFSDADTDHGSAGTAHLMSYELTSFEVGGDAPTTAAGIGLGSTAGDLESAYGSRVTFHPASQVLPDRFTVDFDTDGQISGSLDAPPPDGTVTFLGAGTACGE